MRAVDKQGREDVARRACCTGTVKAPISSILTRTNCTNQVQAAVPAQEAALLG
ncbi:MULTISPECIES: hypothetical protein [unclassified Streptomyces]|uniref:hypothetical protein n=1 Tax=unclassified Streptomyces TaxID=2593676 RepID=UPI002E2B46E8|nr:hypothetical protein [Streptomyces sp. NBC_00228]